MFKDMESKLPPSELSNEEVIGELTKDLEKSLVKEEEIPEEQRDKYSKIEKMEEGDDDDNEESAEDKEKNFRDNYYIDEDMLKDRDAELNDEQIEELKALAEQLKNKGNALFKEGKNEEAASIYTRALLECPVKFNKIRSILYANRAAALGASMKDKSIAIDDCTQAIKQDENYVKAYLRRAHYCEEADRLDEALNDYKKMLTFDPAHTESLCAVKRLEPIVAERNEKLKAEMLDKLKDLGDLILKPFGLSTNNFNLQKDEATGGYSVKFNNSNS